MSFRLRRWESPILNRELRTLLRSNRSFLWLMFFLLVMAIAFTFAWHNVREEARDVAARNLFYTVTVTQGCLFVFLASVLTAGSLAVEHERHTYLLLATTPLSGYHVTLAKCFSALAYVLLLVVATVPFLSMTFLLGGVSWAEVLAASLAILVTVAVAGMTGVAVSAWVRQTLVAVGVTLVLSAGIILTALSATAVVAAFPIALLSLASAARNETTIVLISCLSYAFVQTIVFMGLLHTARNGYLAGPRLPPWRPKRLIRSRQVLRERQRRFPYYLIDPLKAPTPVPDGANPVYVRDTRHQPLGRLDFIIRFSYVCLFASVFVGIALAYAVSEGGMYMPEDLPRQIFPMTAAVSHVAVSIVLLAAPLFGAMAFTSEKEHGTFLPMMTTLMTPAEIVQGKLRIILRYSLLFLGAYYGPAFLVVLMLTTAGAWVVFKQLLWLTPFFVMLILAAGLLGLLVSARTRQNVRSLTVTYLIVALFAIGPPVLEQLLGLPRDVQVTYAATAADRQDMLMNQFEGMASSLLSPYRFLAGGPDQDLSAVRCYEAPERACLYLAVWALIVAGLYFSTMVALREAATSDQVREPG